MIKRFPGPLMVLVLVLLAAVPAKADDDMETISKLLTQSKAAYLDFKAGADFDDFRKMLPNAHALVILPSVIKAGFLLGGEGGNGVLIARNKDGSWGYPAFYTLAAGSFGLQIGVQSTEMIMLIRSPDALKSVLKHQGKFGADAGLTAGVVGVGLEASTTTNMSFDVMVFSSANVGAFGGVSLEGAALVRRNDFNESFYGKGATPEAILLEKKFSNAKADDLRTTLSK